MTFLPLLCIVSREVSPIMALSGPSAVTAERDYSFFNFTGVKPLPTNPRFRLIFGNVIDISAAPAYTASKGIGHPIQGS